MEKRWLCFLLYSFLLWFAPLAGHVGFPFIITAVDMYEFFSWSLVALGLVVEWGCLYYLVGNFIVSLYTVFLMNMVSTLIGSILLFLFRFFFGAYNFFGQQGAMRLSMVHVLLVLVGAVAINTALEYPVARYILARVSKRSLFITIVVANILSAFLGLVALGIYYYSILL